MAHPYIFGRRSVSQNLGSVEEDEPARVVVDGSDYQPFEEYISSYDEFLPPMDALPVPVDNYQGFIVDSQTGQAAVFETTGGNGGDGFSAGGGGGFFGPSSASFSAPAAEFGGVSSPGMTTGPVNNPGTVISNMPEPAPLSPVVTPPGGWPALPGGGPVAPWNLQATVTMPERAVIPREPVAFLPVLVPGVVPGGPSGAFVDDTAPVLAPPGQRPAESKFPWGLLALGALAFLS